MFDEIENVIYLPIATTIDMPIKSVIDGAAEHDMDGIAVIGWTTDGSLYFASSYAKTAETNLLLDLAKDVLISNSRNHD